MIADRKTCPNGTRMNDQSSASSTFLPAMIYMSGDRRGTTALLSGSVRHIVLEGRTGVRVEPPGLTPDSGIVAKLRVEGESCEIEAVHDQKLWINGRLAATGTLRSGDVLEIGRNGPMLRYRGYRGGIIPAGSISEVFGNCYDSARFNQGPFLRKTGKLLGNMTWEFVHRTTLAFRILMLLSIATIAAVIVILFQQNRTLEIRVAEGETQTATLARVLAESEGSAITRDDLLALRGEIEGNLSTTLERVDALELRFGAVAKIVSQASRSVIFLQGSYGFQSAESGQWLRHVDPASTGGKTPPGSQPVTLDGEGPPVEFQFTGTGFIATEDGLIVTSRHVAQPWESEDFTEVADAMGLTPVLHRFIGYLPGEQDSFDVKVVEVSDKADVAILRCSGVAGRIPALQPATSAPDPGNEVVVLGYPAGITAMLARIDRSFLADLAAEEEVDFWAIGERLAQAGYIRPLATRGIVGQVTPSAVVYDAETTRGGSGGPVLNLEGRVVAVNTAILREFDGSNLGVPIERVSELVEAVERVR